MANILRNRHRSRKCIAVHLWTRRCWFEILVLCGTGLHPRLGGLPIRLPCHQRLCHYVGPSRTSRGGRWLDVRCYAVGQRFWTGNASIVLESQGWTRVGLVGVRARILGGFRMDSGLDHDQRNGIDV